MTVHAENEPMQFPGVPLVFIRCMALQALDRVRQLPMSKEAAAEERDWGKWYGVADGLWKNRKEPGRRYGGAGEEHERNWEGVGEHQRGTGGDGEKLGRRYLSTYTIHICLLNFIFLDHRQNQFYRFHHQTT